MENLLLQRLEAIGRSLEQSGKALALIGLGSVGVELERLDRHSDLDFFAVVEDGHKAFFLEDLSWLAKLAPVCYAFRNTADGFKLLYEDGVFCEFAVFEWHELSSASFAPGRLVWKAPQIPDSVAVPIRTDGGAGFNQEWNLGEALTNLYIGLKRLARGEKLSAARFVQHYALDRILELAEQLGPEKHGVLRDPFNRERRLEQRLPGFSNHLKDFAQGYERTAESARAMLDWLEVNFSINMGMARAIREAISATGVAASPEQPSGIEP